MPNEQNEFAGLANAIVAAQAARADQTFPDVGAFAAELRRLHRERSARVRGLRHQRAERRSLSKAERAEILRKAGGRCHICGGEIDGTAWDADHVFAHSNGGVHALENYLPAHSLCNNYRWHYGTTELQWILKLGVWLRTQIEHESFIGRTVGSAFVAHERKRAKRRKTSKSA